MHVAAGMPDDLYWQTTPHERAALLEELEKVRQREDLRFGLVAAQVENWSPRKRGRARRARDFFSLRPVGPPVTDEDRKRLAPFMAPSKSIRA